LEEFELNEDRWLMLSLGWLSYFSFGLINTSIAPLVAPIMGELNLSYTQMGLVLGAWQLVYIFSAQILGFLIDRLGVYRSILLGVFTISISSFLRGISGGFLSLFSSTALFGFGGPLISIGTPKLVALWFRGTERGTASGINASGSIVGSVVALSLTNGLLLPSLGHWRRVFLFYGIMGLLIVVLWSLMGRRKPYAPLVEGGEDLGSVRGTFGTLLRTRDIWVIVGVGVIFFLSNHALKNWLPRILELKGFNPEEAGYAASLMSLTGLIGNLTVPRLSYQVKSKRWTIALILLLSGASISVIGFGDGGSLWTGIILAGYSIRSIMPLLTLTLMEMPAIGSRKLGAASGLLFSIGEIGGFLGPFMMGYLIDATGIYLSGILLLTAANMMAILPLYFLEIKD
jgi:cyanate permease